MIDNEKLKDFLTNFHAEHSINAKVAKILSNVTLCKRSMFYWYNVALYDNICYNKKSLEFMSYYGDNHQNLFDLLAYTVLNLEAVLDKIDSRFMTAWVIPLEQKKDPIHLFQNSNIIQLFNSLHNMNVQSLPAREIVPNLLPIIKSTNALICAKALKICPTKVYYPVDMEKYPIQRALIYNIFLKYGIDMEDDTNENRNKLIKFMNDMPHTLNLQLFVDVVNSINVESSYEYEILLNLIRVYMIIEKRTPNRYESSMTYFEDTIIPTLKKSISEELPTANYQESAICIVPKFCDKDSIEPDIVLKTFNLYPKFIENEHTKLESLNMCPIQVSYIISLFPFYKHRMLVVKNGEIHSEVVNIEDGFSIKLTNFYKLKNLIDFDGNYVKFKNTVQLFNLTYNDVLGYVGAMFENRGFKCSVIIAELMNFHLDAKFDTIGMYELLSNLPYNYLQKIDTENSCKLEQKKVNGPMVMRTILNLNPSKIVKGRLNFDTIEYFIEKIKNATNINDKFIIASKTNFNCIALIKYCRMFVHNFDEVLLLMLFSSAPQNLKNLIYENLSLSEIEFPSNIKLESDVNYELQIQNYKFNTIEDVLKNNRNKNTCIPLLDYYKYTKDPNLLMLISAQVDINNEVTRELYHNPV
ncbi:hypothetical protein CsNV_078 [Callinectes sapidus nudivirus]|nr:hypothetical protein CsNV_078 [Callinectes sapidus nudivirus]